MNILYVLNFTSMAGGSNKSLLSILEIINKYHNVIVITPDNNGIYHTLKKLGITVESIYYIFNIRPQHSTFKDCFLFLPRLIKRKIINRIAEYHLANIVAKYKADIIHTNTSVNEIGYNVAKKIGIPHVMHVREYGDKDHGLHIYGIRKKLSDKDSWNIFITKDIAKYYNCIDSPNSIVIYNPIIKSLSLATKWPRNNFFLYAGRIDSGKGISDLIISYIEYYNIQGKNSTPLIMAGECKSPSQLKLKSAMLRMLKKVGADDKVKWLGEVDNIYDYMAEARAVIVPSIFEGFGRVMPESQAHGALVIGRDTGGTHEQFENGIKYTGQEIGIRFKTRDDLTKALLKVDKMNETEYQRFVINSRKVVRELYTQKASSTQILDFYNKIFADKV